MRRTIVATAALLGISSPSAADEVERLRAFVAPHHFRVVDMVSHYGAGGSDSGPCLNYAVTFDPTRVVLTCPGSKTQIGTYRIVAGDTLGQRLRMTIDGADHTYAIAVTRDGRLWIGEIADGVDTEAAYWIYARDD